VKSNNKPPLFKKMQSEVKVISVKGVGGVGVNQEEDAEEPDEYIISVRTPQKRWKQKDQKIIVTI
jgi:hypothetical protein